jgi:hypothetical protein
VRNKPVFLIYQPNRLPSLPAFIEQWQTLALKNGLQGVHFVAHLSHSEWGVDYKSRGFSGATIVTALKMLSIPLPKVASRHVAKIRQQDNGSSPIAEALRASRRIGLYAGMKALRRILRGSLYVYYYEDASLFFLSQFQPRSDCYPCVIPNWDNSPRSGLRALILHKSTPELFGRHVQEAMRLVQDREPEDRIVFVKSWNEWAEGNYLEPDQRFGRQYLDVLRETVFG